MAEPQIFAEVWSDRLDPLLPPVKDDVPVKADTPQIKGIDINDLAGKPPDDLYPKLADIKRREIEEKEKIYGAMESSFTRDMRREEGAYEDMRKAGVDLSHRKEWNADEEAKKYSHDPLEKFGSLASVAGILAAAFTHQPFENALNASAAAMGAIQQRDDIGFERAHTAWKDNIELAMKRHQVMHQAYEGAASLRAHNATAYDAMMRNQAARFGDQQVLAMMDAGMVKEIEDIKASRQKLALETAKQIPIIDEEMRRAKDLQDTINEKLKEGKFEGKSRSQSMNEALEEFKTRWAEIKGGGSARYLAAQQISKEMGVPLSEAWKMTEPQGARIANQTEDVNSIATGIIEGRIDPNLTGFYKLKGPVEAELSRRNFNLADAKLAWSAAQKQVSSLNSTQMVRFIGLASSVINTIDEVKSLAEKMALSGIPALNQVELTAYIQTQGNSPKGQLAARYVTAVNTLKEEFANVAQGGYAPTESVWHLANRQINENYGVKELGASLDEVQRLMRFRVNAIPGLSTKGPGAPNRYNKPEATEDFGGWK